MLRQWLQTNRSHQDDMPWLRWTWGGQAMEFQRITARLVLQSW
jgi:hypothetical protein